MGILSNKLSLYILFVVIETITINLSLFLKKYEIFWIMVPISYMTIYGVPISFFKLINVLIYGNQNKTSKKLYALEVIPFVVSFSILLWLFLQPVTVKGNIFDKIKDGKSAFPFYFLDILFVLQSAIYVVASYRKVYLYKNANPNNPRVRIYWKFINFFVMVGPVIYMANFLPTASVATTLISLSISVIIFYNLFLYESIKHSNTYFSRDNKKKQLNAINSSAKNIPPYNKDKITESINVLIHEDKIFKNTNIDIALFAEKCNVPKYLMIQFINREYGKRFPEFITEFRVEEAKKLLSSSELQKYNIEVISQMCGFNSRSSFYAIFKKYTGMSPVQYTKYIENDNVNKNAQIMLSNKNDTSYIAQNN